MSEWMVECHGDAREVYCVEAETEQEAMDNWASGFLQVSEASSMESVSAVKDD